MPEDLQDPAALTESSSRACLFLAKFFRKALFVFVLLFLAIGFDDEVSSSSGTEGCSSTEASGTEGCDEGPSGADEGTSGARGCASSGAQGCGNGNGASSGAQGCSNPSGSGAQGCSDSGSGARGCNSGARGCNSGARGCNSGARGCNSGAHGCNSGVVGCYSGGGMMGCVMVPGGLVGCNGDADLFAQQITAFVLLPLTIVLSAMYVLSLMVAMSIAITMSFLVPFILIGYAICIGSVLILVIGVIAGLVLAAIWMKDAMQPEARRSRHHRSPTRDHEDDSESSEEEEPRWMPSGAQRIQLLFLGLAILVGVFLILCLTTYGQLVSIMPPETMPPIEFRTTTTTVSQEKQIPGSNKWAYCNHKTHNCYSERWCCCDKGFTWDGWSCS